MKRETPEISRRAFIGSVAAAGAAAVSAANIRAQTSQVQLDKPVEVTPKAADGRLLKAGLIGCGGRGRGAAVNFLDAGPNLQVVALADVFADRVADARRVLKDQRGQEIADSH